HRPSFPPRQAKAPDTPSGRGFGELDYLPVKILATVALRPRTSDPTESRLQDAHTLPVESRFQTQDAGSQTRIGLQRHFLPKGSQSPMSRR
ncbi:MAG: hypothetical protein AB1646_22265, partial [Thermodesulfobacteriota bacterium]